MTADKRKLTDLECELLISEVQIRNCLWNDRHNDFKNSVITKKMWEEVGQAVNMQGEECKKKWKNLKDTFRKKTPPGKYRRDSSPPNKKWKFESLMEFTRDTTPPIPIFGNLTSAIQDDDEEESNIDEGVSEVCQEDDERFSLPQRFLKITWKKEEAENRLLELEENKVNGILNMGNGKDMGGDQHFFLSLLPYMTRLTVVEKLQLRNKIQNCVLEALKDHASNRTRHK